MSKVILHSGKSINSYVCATILKEFPSYDQIYICNYKDVPVDRYILLNAASYNILSDLWNHLDQFLHSNGTPLLKHNVIDNNGEILSIDFHQTYIINSRFLLDNLFGSLTNSKNISFTSSQSLEVSKDTIEINNLARSFSQISFGQRQLIHVEVFINENIANESYFEMTEDSWFYLAPFSKTQFILQIAIPSYVQNPEDTFLHLVSKTRKIRQLYNSYDQSSIAIIPISPFFRITSKANEFLTGSSLMKFDPVSGYGLLNTMRSAILASASLKFDKYSDECEYETMAHYMNRNMTGMIDHIKACINLYSSFSTTKWSMEVELMKSGLKDLAYVYNSYKVNRQFHLYGFELKEKAHNNVYKK